MQVDAKLAKNLFKLDKKPSHHDRPADLCLGLFRVVSAWSSAPPICTGSTRKVRCWSTGRAASSAAPA